MNRELVQKTEAFLKETFAASGPLPGLDYRLEHSYRVANIARRIARAESFDETHAVIAGLLHDIAYCEEMPSREDALNHGRRGAEIARPFLEKLGLSPTVVNDICYGIAIHVDDVSSFVWKRTPFAETVGDADNIDRFDAYRIYETLRWQKFDEMPLEEKKTKVRATLERLEQLREMKLGTAAAGMLWLQRLDFYAEFYEHLRRQLETSEAVMDF